MDGGWVVGVLKKGLATSHSPFGLKRWLVKDEQTVSPLWLSVCEPHKKITASAEQDASPEEGDDDEACKCYGKDGLFVGWGCYEGEVVGGGTATFGAD